MALLGIKNNLDNNIKLKESCYVLKIIICRENKIKDCIELSPAQVLNIILNVLYYELNEIPIPS